MRAHLAWIALALATLPGCGFLFVTIADATRGPPGPLSESSHVRGITAGGMAQHPIQCGAASSSPQRDHAFVAAQGGTYTFTSTTSDYDGVIAVFDASGNELACNDDHGSTRQSEVSVALAEGQAVVVVQGGYAGSSGSYEMWVTGVGGGATGQITLADGSVVPVTPAGPPQELPAGASVQGDTSGLGTIAGIGCPSPSSMQEWHFVAPADGSYVFQADATFGVGLGLYDDGGASLACGSYFGDATHARVVMSMAQGQSTRVIVGGGAGAYSLTAIATSAGGALTLGRPVLFEAGSTSGEPDLCGAQPGSVDRTFTFTPRAEAFYAVSTDATGTLVIGDGRRTAACVPLGGSRRVGVVLKAGHRYSLVLELGVPDGQAHTLAIDRVDPSAPDWQVPMAAPPIAAFTTPIVDPAPDAAP